MNEFNFGMGANSSGRSMTVREFLESVPGGGAGCRHTRRVAHLYRTYRL